MRVARVSKAYVDSRLETPSRLMQGLSRSGKLVFLRPLDAWKQPATEQSAGNYCFQSQAGGHRQVRSDRCQSEV